MQLVRTSENYRLRLLVSNERSMEPLFLEYKSNSISRIGVVAFWRSLPLA